MPSSPGVPTGGAPSAVVYARPWERHPVKEVGAMGGDAQELSPRLHCDDNSEAKTLEHEEKVNKYQDVLVAYLDAKYFASKAYDKGDVFEEITIQSETIQFSRWPVTSLFADPAKFYQEKNVHLWSLPPLPSAIVNLRIVEPRQNEQIIWLQETFGKW